MNKQWGSSSTGSWIFHHLWYNQFWPDLGISPTAIFLLKVVWPSLVFQWLRLHLPIQGLRVQSLMGALRSHMPWGQETKHKTNRSNILTNSMKTFKKLKNKGYALSLSPLSDFIYIYNNTHSHIVIWIYYISIDILGFATNWQIALWLYPIKGKLKCKAVS